MEYMCISRMQINMRFLLFQLFMTSWSANRLLTSGCSIAGEWKRLSVEERMFLFDIVVVGTDVQHVKNNGTDFYDSEFRVSCVLKGDGKEIGENITIPDIQPENSCLRTVLTAGEDFIVGLERTPTGYRRHIVNVNQPVSFPNTTEYLQIASTVCGLQSPKRPNGTIPMSYDFCQAQNQTGPCFSGSGRNGYVTGVIMATLPVAFILNLL